MYPGNSNESAISDACGQVCDENNFRVCRIFSVRNQKFAFFYKDIDQEFLNEKD